MLTATETPKAPRAEKAAKPDGILTIEELREFERGRYYPSREFHILAALDELAAEQDEWQSLDTGEDDEQGLPAQRRVSAPPPPKSWWSAAKRFVLLAGEGGWPATLNSILPLVEQFGEVVVAHVDRWGHVVHEHWPRSNDKIFNVLADIREVRLKSESSHEMPRLETMAELREQHVTDEQIARIYGLYMPDGETAASHLIQRELDKPGSVIDDNWVDPRVRDREQEQAGGSFPKANNLHLLAQQLEALST